MVGNSNSGRKDKFFADAIRVAVKRTDGDRTQLALIAEKVIEEAKEGNMVAVNIVADRLDGKPQTNIDVTTTKRVEQMSDEELYGVIKDGAARASGETDIEEEASPKKSKRLH